MQTAIGHWGETMFPLFSILKREASFAWPPAQFVLLHLKRVSTCCTRPPACSLPLGLRSLWRCQSQIQAGDVLQQLQNSSEQKLPAAEKYFLMTGPLKVIRINKHSC